MSRVIRVGGAQLGPIQKSEGRQIAVARMIDLLDQKKAREEDYTYLTEDLGYGPTMPAVIQARRMISRIDRQILELEAAWLAKDSEEGAPMPVPPQIAELLTTYKALEVKIAELQAEVNDIATRLSAVAEEELKLEQTQEELRTVTRKIVDFDESDKLLSENDQITRVLIGDKAPMPTAPSNAGKRVQFAVFRNTCGNKALRRAISL